MSTRSGVLTALGAAALAGCSSNAAPPADQSDAASTATNQSNSTETDTDQGNELTLSGREWYFNWIHGEDEQILENVQGDDWQSISFQAIDNALEEGINQGRNHAVAQALETASKEFAYQEDYEERHRHILSAVHQTLEQKEGGEWDFDIFSNMNYTETIGETIQYSEIKVETGETTDDGHKEYAIINAALKNEYDHATHVPGEQTTAKDSKYKQTMSGVRSSASDIALPPHDTEAIQNRINRVGAEDEEQAYASWAGLMGYQLFAGGSEVDGRLEYKPDELLVPIETAHELIDEIGYEQGNQTDENGDTIATHGRMDLQLAMNEKYFSEEDEEYGETYAQIDDPIAIESIESTDSGWSIELDVRPDWTSDRGYPEQAR